MKRAAFLIALALLAGCGSESGGDGMTQVDPDPTLVTYQRGGGIAATYVEVTIDQDGTATYTSGYDQPGHPAKAGGFELTEAQMDDLRAAIDAAQPLSVENGETGCADCYEYEIDAGGQAVAFDDVELTDGTVSDGIAALQAKLQEIADTSAKPRFG
jgi:hypothetical protein